MNFHMICSTWVNADDEKVLDVLRASEHWLSVEEIATKTGLSHAKIERTLKLLKQQMDMYESRKNFYNGALHQTKRKADTTMKKALIVYGGWEGHDPKGVADVFTELLEAENFEVTLSDTLDAFLGDLTQYNLIVPIWTMGELSWEAEQNVCKAVASGVGIAGCHGGMCDAFRTSTEWQFMTGSQWVAHPGGDTVTYKVYIKKSAASDIIADLEDFEVTSEQYYIHVDPAVNVLATTRFVLNNGSHISNGEVEVPVVYTKRWGKGKVFYNSLGHNHYIFDIPDAKELMRRGFLYAAK